MEKITEPKPFEVIAQKFKISNESAKYFLVQVQKSFKTEKPPQDMILDLIMIKKLRTLPTPHALATMLNENGIWIHPLNAAPPVLQDDDDGYFTDKAPAPSTASKRKKPTADSTPKRPAPAPRKKLPPGRR